MKKRNELIEDIDFIVIPYKNGNPKAIKCCKSDRVYKFPRCQNLAGYRYAAHSLLDKLYEDLKNEKWQFLYYTKDQEDFSDPKEKIYKGTFMECCKKFKEFIDSDSKIEAVDEEARLGDTKEYKYLSQEMFKYYI